MKNLPNLYRSLRTRVDLRTSHRLSLLYAVLTTYRLLKHVRGGWDYFGHPPIGLFALVCLGVFWYLVFHVSTVLPVLISHVYSCLGRHRGIKTPSPTSVNVSSFTTFNTSSESDSECIH